MKKLKALIFTVPLFVSQEALAFSSLATRRQWQRKTAPSPPHVAASPLMARTTTTRLQAAKHSNDDKHKHKHKNNDSLLLDEQQSRRDGFHKTALSCLLALSLLVTATPLLDQAVAEDAFIMGDLTTTTTTTTTTISSPHPATTANTVRAGLNARRYWTIMASQDEGADELRVLANDGLLDYAVVTVNTMYYDNTGGARFTSREFYDRWRALRDETRQQQQVQQQESLLYQHHHDDNKNNKNNNNNNKPTSSLATRQGAVQNLKWLISTLNDPFSKYLTREELYQELNTRNDGFLGIGALVETPEQGEQFFARGSAPTLATVIPDDYSSNRINNILYSHRQLLQQAKSVISNSHHHNNNDHTTNLNNNNNNKAASPSTTTSALSFAMVQNLPVVTAVVPDSPAERAGITVGDRVVAVGEYSFLGQSRNDVSRNFQTRFATATNYFGTSDVTVAKPVVRTLLATSSLTETSRLSDTASPAFAGDNQKNVQASILGVSSSSNPQLTTTTNKNNVNGREREVVIGYRQTRVRLPTKSLEENSFSQLTRSLPVTPQDQSPTMGMTTTGLVASSQGVDSSNAAGLSSSSISSTTIAAASPAASSTMTSPPTKGGNSIVHWELISEQSPQQSIFQRSFAWASDPGDPNNAKTTSSKKVGYIRLTRFSKASTAGYIEAVNALEQLGATSFIIDVRNNYGGIIQEAMLTASTLLRDPHAVMCYTMNARGGFTPHDVEEYLVDQKFPGYLLSTESRWVTLRQAQRENPDMFDDGGSHWVPPSSYASLHEQTAKRGLHRPALSSSSSSNDETTPVSSSWLQWNTAAANAYANHNEQWMAQRNLVVLINEGTASAAEVFASSLHDNGRTLALIGTRTYGKGLIQHTFPMPDGGGLRLTVAEYLTPALRHVTVVGNAKFDPDTGDQVGGGIKPDLHCASKQGIPSNIGADLCVGMALDVLEEAESASSSRSSSLKLEKLPALQKQQEPHNQEPLWMKNGILANNNVGSNTDSASILSASSDAGSIVEDTVSADAKETLQQGAF